MTCVHKQKLIHKNNTQNISIIWNSPTDSRVEHIFKICCLKIVTNKTKLNHSIFYKIFKSNSAFTFFVLYILFFNILIVKTI